jgi:hyaluronan synthase
MNKQGWLTRNSDTIGGEGQNSASLGDTTPAATPVTAAAATPAMTPAAAITSAKATSGLGAFPS